MKDRSLVRAFSLIAHVDHGKSTLADRILQVCKAVPEREMREQYLDRMDLERERGITIKAQAIRLQYPARDGKIYELNLIDTPGHVDFSYEVSRSLAACDGVILLVDAAQGIEAQTLANLYLAIEAGLEVIPAVNKIDLPAADPERVSAELSSLIGVSPDSVLRVSGKTGAGVVDLLEEVIRRVPSPKGAPDDPTRALIFDSTYDNYRGVVSFVRVLDGELTARQKVKMMATGSIHELEEVGVFAPSMMPVARLEAGDVGYAIPGVKNVREAKVGDTITDASRPADEPLHGYREPKPMVWAGLYPTDGDQYADLRDALDKLRLNDAAFVYEPETSQALGFGFRCGFLGLLHMDIVRERLEREFDLDLLITVPSVAYEVVRVTGEVISVHNPAEMPDPAAIQEIREPVAAAMIITPKEFLGTLMELCQERRGEMKEMHYLSEDRVEIRYHLPLAEMIVDFFDQLKSRTRGYGSLDYEPIGNRAEDLVKVEILLHGEPVDAFSAIVHRERAYTYGRKMVEKLRELVPRQMFDVAVQASIGSRIIARETIRARRKDVLAKCYGGDITRKRKLLEKQKAGKRRMKQVGSVEIPQEAFMAALRLDDKK
ncbi:MAG TPA: translation elongation factor 4 [Actinomycetota bacterium]|nr:translation elongation factor 4 [Actinomycetota bacterium]